MSLNVGKLQATLEIEASAFTTTLNKAKADLRDLADQAARMGQATKQAGSDAAQGASRAADGAKKQAQESKRAGDEARRSGEAGRKAGQATAQGSTRATSSIKSTGTAAQQLRARFNEASNAGQTMKVSSQPAAELKTADGAAGGLVGSLNRVKGVAAGLGVAFGAQQIVQFFTGAVSAARDAEAIMFRTTNTFGDAAGAVEGWAGKSARGFGLSEDAAKSAALQFSSFGLALGKSGEGLGEYSTDLAELAADLAAYGDYDIETVVQDMSSALAGGTETMRKYGVMLDQSTLRQIAFEQGITESNRELTQEERVLAATAAMHDKLGYAVGASAASQGTFGAAVRDLKAGFADATVEIGGKFLPIVTAVTGLISGPGLAAVGGFGSALGLVLAPITALATLFTGLPGPIQTAIGAMAAMRVGTALLGTELGNKLTQKLTVGVGAVANLGGALKTYGGTLRTSVASQGLAATSMGALRSAAGGLQKGIGSLVGALGGPWMIALAATVGVVASFVSSAKSASAANQALEDATASGAAAQKDLAGALKESNGAMSDQAVAAAQKIVQSELDKTNTKAEQSHNIFSQTAVVMGRVGGSYDTFAHAAENATSSMDRSAAATEMAKMENEALSRVAADLGIEMDDVARIVAEGGPEFDALRNALMGAGDEGIAMAGKLEHSKGVIDDVAASTDSAERASALLSDAYRVMADEASTAEEKTNALKAALDALAGEQLTADEAAKQYYETLDKTNAELDKLTDGSGSYFKSLEDGSLAFDLTSESGRTLHDQLVELRDSTAEYAAAGEDMGPIWERNGAVFQKLADDMNVPVEVIKQLAAEALGFSEQDISNTVAIRGGGQVVGELADIATQLDGVSQGTEVEIKNVSDEALAYLQSVGWEAERLEGSPTDIKVTASTDGARSGLKFVAEAAARVNNAPADVDVSTNAGFVTQALGITADSVNALPDGHVEITDTTPENIARLEGLGIKVNEPKNGVVTINDQDVNRARDNVNTLNNNNTSSTHTVYIGTVNRGGNDQSSGGTTVGQHYGADGGFLPTQSFADGGLRTDTLPDAAVIAQPQGTRGLVQWAEAETEGEAFIPLAKSKRRRSLSIWAEVGRKLGALDKFADGGILPQGDGTKGDMGGLLAGKFANGGIMASGLIDLAKGVEGKPYVWGGVQYGDCSGAVSSLANFVAGRAPFGSRFATGNQRQALAERGFVNGRGGAGDLRMGWYNGGPYGGHTAATLPNGVNFEMGGGRGNGQYGGQAAGADDSSFTDHAYFPMQRFADIDAAIGTSAYDSVAGQLGGGTGGAGGAAGGLDVTVEGGGTGTPVYVTNWPGSGSAATGNITAKTTGDTTSNAFLEAGSPAGALASALGQGGLIKSVEQFADGGFHGIENHSAHIAKAGSYRIFGEPETGGEAYIPLASNKRARSMDILAETARRFGYQLGAGVNLAGSVLTGNGLNTGWGGPSLSDLGIDTSAMQDVYAAKIEQAARLMVEANAELVAGVDNQVEGTLQQAALNKNDSRQQYARAMI